MARIRQTQGKSTNSTNTTRKTAAKKPAAKPVKTEKPTKKETPAKKEKAVRRSRVKYTLDNTDLHHAIALEKRLTTAPKRESKPKVPSAVDHELAKRIVACKSFKDFVNYSFKKEVGDAKPSAAPSQVLSRLVKAGIAVEKN